MTGASVVVVTRDRASRLRALLDSLAGQEGPGFEVVVVDDGSTDSTQRVLEHAEPQVRSVRLLQSRGPAVARNVGWRETGGDVVAFIDDDCVAQPGWIASLTKAVSGELTFAQGRTLPDPAELGQLSPFSRTQSVDEAGPWFQTCNIAYPRSLLERLGGFDESYSHFAEDTDLGWRALEAGAKPAFAAGAVVHHAVHPVGALELARRSQAWVDPVKVLGRHPALKRQLRLGLFWKPSHERLLYALAGAVLAKRTRGLSLALVAPYLALLRRSHASLPGALATLPAHLLVDGAEMVAMARGSARHRTLVL